MSKQQFDLNDEARNKIDEQYEYADERISDPSSAMRPKPKQKSVPRSTPSAGAAKKRAVSKPVRRKAPVRQTAPPHIDTERGSASAPPPPPPVFASAPQPEYTAAPAEKKPGSGKFLRIYKRIAVVIIILGIIYIALNVGFLYFRGALWFNEPRKRDYPVRGAVVTSELGTVDWNEFQYQPITFAYVRATRSTSFIDEQYEANRKGIDESKLWAGFYHEFDYSDDGEKQAEHYIDTVGDLEGELRPAVKLTAYGAYKIKLKSAEKVKEQLDKFMKRLKKEYSKKVVIMCDDDCYEKYVKPYYSDQTLWLIDHFSEPDKDSKWALWEYNPRVRSPGYENKSEYYSVVVYRHGKGISNFRKNFEIGYE